MEGQVSLATLDSGKAARVLRIEGGMGMRRRLQSLGIRPGVQVRKVSSALRPGAVVVETGGGQTALGHGVARKIILENTA